MQHFTSRLAKALYMLSFILFLNACAVNTDNRQNAKTTNQSGDLVLSYLESTYNKTPKALTRSLSHWRTSKPLKELVSENTQNVVELFMDGTLSSVVNHRLSDVNWDSLSHQPEKLAVLLKLFPVDAYRLVRIGNESMQVEPNVLVHAVTIAGLDPTVALSGTSSNQDNQITPLIHSAGIVIYGQNEDTKNEVQFKEVSSESWRAAMPLAWEPVYGALSGSLVYLNPNTEYDVEVTVTEESGDIQKYEFDFKTKADTPPIDEDKIYNLADIYSGGQLDIEALGIQGSEQGYAKIVGNGEVIEANSDDFAAINLGAQSYIVLENLIVKGGKRHGIFSHAAHHIWIKNCDISEYGRIAADYRNNVGYENTNSESPINYDAGIYLEKTGVVVIEETQIYNPNGNANHWGYGHPHGPTAILINAQHENPDFSGQTIIRNNKLYGTATHRFNDVIEGRYNASREGGFVRDSAIYGNYLAYANDDLIELDGGQQNVLVYNNEMTKGYAGVSVAPNRLGPSYIFHNYIHDLGDERGREWTAIKAGGLMSSPAGKTFILENYIITNRNALASSRFRGDTTMWVDVRNNVFITRNSGNKVGYSVYDQQKYEGSQFVNNVFYNLKVQGARLDISFDNYSANPLSEDSSFIERIINEKVMINETDSADVINNMTSFAPISVYNIKEN